MNRLAVIADKVAKSITAGVSIGVKDFSPKDMSWIENQLHDTLREFNRDDVRIDADGTTNYSEFTGTLNIYCRDEEVAKLVFHKADDFVTHLRHLTGIVGKVRQDMSRMYKQPTVRVDIEMNKDEEFADMMSTSIMYSRWRLILNWLGLPHVNEEHGSMPIREYLEAYKTPGDFEGKEREAVFARQIALMAQAALKRGYKEISWA
jgi:hypothetical protein